MKYDVYLVDFYYEDSPADYKLRPAVVLEEGSIAYLFSKITSNKEIRSTYDYLLKDWEEAGLKVPSVLRLDKRLILNDKHVYKKIGHLSKNDIKNIEEILNKNEGLNLSKYRSFLKTAYEDPTVSNLFALREELNNLDLNESASVKKYCEQHNEGRPMLKVGTRVEIEPSKLSHKVLEGVIKEHYYDPPRYLIEWKDSWEFLDSVHEVSQDLEQNLEDKHEESIASGVTQSSSLDQHKREEVNESVELEESKLTELALEHKAMLDYLEDK